MNELFLKKAVLLSILFLAFTQVQAQEEKFITLYLYNFTKYIEWPGEYKKGDFVIDVLGHKSVYDRLDQMLNAKKRGKQNFVVNNPTSVDEINSNCNILFVGHWKSKYLQEALEQVTHKGTLIITEKPGMLADGSAINLIIRNKKIQYEVKKSNLRRSGLSYSNDLTSLATRVIN
mgnify:CR=1 FL=1